MSGRPPPPGAQPGLPRLLALARARLQQPGVRRGHPAVRRPPAAGRPGPGQGGATTSSSGSAAPSRHGAREHTARAVRRGARGRPRRRARGQGRHLRRRALGRARRRGATPSGSTTSCAAPATRAPRSPRPGRWRSYSPDDVATLTAPGPAVGARAPGPRPRGRRSPRGPSDDVVFVGARYPSRESLLTALAGRARARCAPTAATGRATPSTGCAPGGCSRPAVPHGPRPAPRRRLRRDGRRPRHPQRARRPGRLHDAHLRGVRRRRRAAGRPRRRVAALRARGRAAPSSARPRRPPSSPAGPRPTGAWADGLRAAGRARTLAEHTFVHRARDLEAAVDGLTHPRDLEAWHRWQDRQPAGRAARPADARGAARHRPPRRPRRQRRAHPGRPAAAGPGLPGVALARRRCGPCSTRCATSTPPTSPSSRPPGVTDLLPDGPWTESPGFAPDRRRPVAAGGALVLSTGHYLPLGAARAAAADAGALPHRAARPAHPARPAPGRRHDPARLERGRRRLLALGPRRRRLGGGRVPAALGGRRAPAGHRRPGRPARSSSASCTAPSCPATCSPRPPRPSAAPSTPPTAPTPPSATGRSVATHARWEAAGITIDRSGIPLRELGAPVVSVFSTGVLEAAAAGLPAWVDAGRPADLAGASSGSATACAVGRPAHRLPRTARGGAVPRRRRGRAGDDGGVRILCVVPARGGSKGVPRKNLRGCRRQAAHRVDHRAGPVGAPGHGRGGLHRRRGDRRRRPRRRSARAVPAARPSSPTTPPPPSRSCGTPSPRRGRPTPHPTR